MPAPSAGAAPGPGTASLPPVILVTDRHRTTRPLPDVVAAAVTGGLRLVIVREKDLPPGERVELAHVLREHLAPVGGWVLLSGPGPGPDGCHLAATDPWTDPAPGLLGRSCHDEGELAEAAAAGAHYATLSPVFATASKPGYGPPLGPEVLARATAGVPLPVFALGGITTAERAQLCMRAGAAGVAVMGALMRSVDPAGMVRDLLRAVTVR